MLLLLCSICSELIKPVDTIHSTQCGHLFHQNCIQQWIKRSKTCPHCRSFVTAESIVRVYPTISNDIPTGGDQTFFKLQIDLDQTVQQLNEKRFELQECHKEIEEKNTKLDKTEGALVVLEEKVKSRDCALAAFKEQIKYLKNENIQLNQVREELKSAKMNLSVLEGLQKLFNGTVEEVEHMLKDYRDLRTVATFAAALKKALHESESINAGFQKRLRESKRDLTLEKIKIADLKATLKEKQEILMMVQSKYDLLKDQLEVKNKTADSNKGCRCILNPSSPPDTIHPSSLDETVLGKGNKILHTTKSENADSPYLDVRLSNPALAAIMVQPSTSKGGPLKPDPLDSLSIFREKVPRFFKLIPDDDLFKSETNPSYDGLGGHTSTSEAFPKKNTKCIVPKLTVKHKLKRPAPSNAQNIEKMFKKLTDK